MDNYEINILRRGGNWKKVKPDDLVIDEMNNDLKDDSQQNNQNKTLQKHILFFSNFCQFSNDVCKKLEKLNIKNNFIMINFVF